MSDLSFQQRLDALERKTTSLRRMLILMVVLFALAATIATTQAQQKDLTFSDAAGNVRVRIDAQGFHLFDAKGTTQLVLGPSSAETPVLAFYDETGAQRMWVGYHNNPYIDMAGANGKDLIEIAASDYPSEKIYDSSNTERLYLGMSSGNGDLLRMFAKDGHEVVDLGQTDQEDGLLRMFATTSQQVVSLEGQATPFLQFNQSDGKERGVIGVSGTGGSLLKLFDNNGTERVYAGEYTDGTSGFTNYNATGAVTWRSP
ncbi:MAG TPA: hypothetical protein VMF11_13980 [Candidatus Baltobacteraceae bacterium]|nr:hypothetical protein [Candidatus Baltobacteraceae bacterium]